MDQQTIFPGRLRLALWVAVVGTTLMALSCSQSGKVFVYVGKGTTVVAKNRSLLMSAVGTGVVGGALAGLGLKKEDVLVLDMKDFPQQFPDYALGSDRQIVVLNSNASFASGPSPGVVIGGKMPITRSPGSSGIGVVVEQSGGSNPSLTFEEPPAAPAGQALTPAGTQSSSIINSLKLDEKTSSGGLNTRPFRLSDYVNKEGQSGQATVSSGLIINSEKIGTGLSTKQYKLEDLVLDVKGKKVNAVKTEVATTEYESIVQSLLALTHHKK